MENLIRPKETSSAPGKPHQPMTRNSRAILVRELAGAAFMIILGSMLHFAFEWAGGWRPLALVAAVNESIWEHLKLAFWPGLLWAVIMSVPSDMTARKVMAVKALTLLATACLIVAIFTSYTAILGRNLLALDIATFVLAILAGQTLSAWLLSHQAGWTGIIARSGLILLVLQILAYSLFTYFPPDHWLFIEASSGQRGIP